MDDGVCTSMKTWLAELGVACEDQEYSDILARMQHAINTGYSNITTEAGRFRRRRYRIPLDTPDSMSLAAGKKVLLSSMGHVWQSLEAKLSDEFMPIESMPVDAQGNATPYTDAVALEFLVPVQCDGGWYHLHLKDTEIEEADVICSFPMQEPDLIARLIVRKGGSILYQQDDRYAFQLEETHHLVYPADGDIWHCMREDWEDDAHLWISGKEMPCFAKQQMPEVAERYAEAAETIMPLAWAFLFE